MNWLTIKWMLLTIWHVGTHFFESGEDREAWCNSAAHRWADEEERKAARNG